MAERVASPLTDATFSGVKVVEFAHLTAGPLAGTLLADLGAEVVHVEAPGAGDDSRRIGFHKDGVHLWWKVGSRNKRSLTLDLRTEPGRAVARRLLQWADVLITNFRVETLEGWQLDWESVQALNPSLIMLHVSGFGTDTSKRNDPGYGKVGEAMSGVVQISGFPDGPPVHSGFSHADTVTALMGAFGVAGALYRRSVATDWRGERIDLALFETLYRLIEWQVIMYDQLGRVPERVGNEIWASDGALVNAYRSRDGVWITVTSGTPRSVQHIAELAGERADDYETVQLQRQNRPRLDARLRGWIASRDAETCLEEMRRLEVVACKVFTVEDIVQDPTYREREDIIVVDDCELGPVRMQAVVPKFEHHPGAVWRTGPTVGQDNDLVLRGYLGMSEAEVATLTRDGTI